MKTRMKREKYNDFLLYNSTGTLKAKIKVSIK